MEVITTLRKTINIKTIIPMNLLISSFSYERNLRNRTYIVPLRILKDRENVENSRKMVSVPLA